MELNDAFRRIIGQHWRLLGACLIAGLAIGILLAPSGKQYTASARLVLDTPDPVAQQQSAAYADTAKAIATSPAAVSGALRAAGVQRGDPAAYAASHIAVQPLGSSGVIQLSVSDRNRAASAKIANALAASVIRTRRAVTNGQVDRTFANLDRSIADFSRRIAAIDQQVSALDVQIAAASRTDTTALRGQRDAAESTREFLVQQRAVVQSERVSLLSANAQRPAPSIISKATPPLKPTSSHLTVYLALGTLLGLILGIGAAGVIETVRPTLVGGDTLAGELHVALLGTLESGASPAAATDVTARLRLAAEAARVKNVALVAAGPPIDLDELTRSLKESIADVPANGNGHKGGHLGAIRIASYDAGDPPFNNGSRSGIVLVSPPALKKTELSDAAHLLQASRLPLLGVITYARQQDSQSPFEQLKRLVTK